MKSSGAKPETRSRQQRQTQVIKTGDPHKTETPVKKETHDVSEKKTIDKPLPAGAGTGKRFPIF